MKRLLHKLNEIVDNFQGYTSESFHNIPWGKAAEVYCDFYTKLDSLLSEHGYEFIGQGRQRRVYRRGNFVLKIPHNIFGEDSNFKEDYTYKKYKRSSDEVNYAPCRLYGKYLVMLYVDEFPDKEKPGWASFIDCYQVGKTKSGKIMAYDYGY